MYEIVDSENKLKEFNRIWMECWKEKGYEIEPVRGEKFLFKNDKVYVGTMELTPIHNDFPFKEHPSVKGKVFEIDKLAILPEHRRSKILANILSTIYQFGIENEVTCFVALIEPKLFKALKVFYKLPVYQLGEKFWYKGDEVVPFAILPEDVLNEENYPWYVGKRFKRLVHTN
ncbi:GNAT family N-acetyltransferase [Fredinandcohnia onubensis]|uniref:GNAT family N-acetyltransferase n=1 Tax=Fredinandcohnia onubensis TaxID=1571209 RepID=UPI000C0BCCD7|nr:GNAT family N-acetyltransferase [Fredinandcohnia onubensis]